VPGGLTISVGEPGGGLSGWRLSHRQAAAALPIALRRAQPIVRYAEVGLIASAYQDEVLRASLRQLYLEPLERDRDHGAAARETLRAYFDANGNTTSAAAALGVTRQTVNNRLRAVEQRLGRCIGECASELSTALGLEELDQVPVFQAEVPPSLSSQKIALSDF
jgi:DNA-binding PucR family transcriptional regulator